MSRPPLPPAGTARFIGAPEPERRAAGLPGHCDACALPGHDDAHPDLDCANVGCLVAHRLDESGRPRCADCGLVITGPCLSDLPLPGEAGTDQLRHWHTGPSACEKAIQEEGGNAR